MGDSISYHEPVSKVLKERFQASLILMGTAWILSGILGFTLGVISGTYRGSILDNIIKTVSLLFASTPVFWIGLVMLVISQWSCNGSLWVLQHRQENCLPKSPSWNDSIILYSLL